MVPLPAGVRGRGKRKPENIIRTNTARSPDTQRKRRLNQHCYASLRVLKFIFFFPISVASLAVVNITTSRYQKFLGQEGIENYWGFDQIFSMVTLAVLVVELLRATVVGMRWRAREVKKVLSLRDEESAVEAMQNEGVPAGGGRSTLRNVR